MRVIGGAFRSRLLSAPPGTKTRPTSDRLRETLFNILAPRIAGCRFVDLFAGTGAVGIEAISRGASHVFFAEDAAPALKVLRGNLAALGIREGYTIEERGVTRLLSRLGEQPHLVDVVFLDPPYNDVRAYTSTLDFFSTLAGQRVLSPGALVLAEHATRAGFELPPQNGALVRTRLLRQGDTSLSFYKLHEEERGADTPNGVPVDGETAAIK